LDRRRLIKGIGGAAIASAFLGWQRLHADGAVPAAGFGRLHPDPGGVLDLPEGFSYRVLARSGEGMADGLRRPARPDGMAAFAGSDGRVRLVCNHENSPEDTHFGPFGDDLAGLSKIDRARVFDLGGDAPGAGQGGTTTLVLAPDGQRLERQFLSLAGTERNCAGGPTPWGSWLSCEETTERAGGVRARDHGWVFEVPADHDGLVVPRPLTALGRFRHEAAAIGAGDRVVYLTEDQGDGLFYRVLLDEPGKLAAGGRLQALAFADAPGLDTRNWASRQVETHRRHAARWIDLDKPEAPDDDLRYRGHAAGAAVFARGEGCWAGDGSIHFACTSGGARRMGQLFAYHEQEEAIELLVESDGKAMRNCDNLTVAPWGDLIVCEDTDDHCRLIGVTPEGSLYPLAQNLYNASELAGACFAPDGRTLYVNIQTSGLTLAISGPFPESAAG
jgi:hypothetical protein